MHFFMKTAQQLVEIINFDRPIQICIANDQSQLSLLIKDLFAKNKCRNEIQHMFFYISLFLSRLFTLVVRN